MIDLAAGELVSLMGSGSGAAFGGLPIGAVVRFAADEAPPDGWPAPPADLPSLPVVIVGVTQVRVANPAEHPAASWCDAIVEEGDGLAQIRLQVERSPLASVAFAQVLRGAPGRSLDDALLIESAVYSTLQGGPEFRGWLRDRPSAIPAVVTEPAVVVSRVDNELRIELNRPHVHNALDSQMRDELIEALAVARADSAVDRIVVSGAGPSFCSGGDLAEFGSFPDPATAHLLRQSASVARMLARLSARTEVRLHGACMGSGIELPAFAQRVVAAVGTRIALPELGLGLIPGAGGTWSIPQRIGRHRTALLALSGEPIDAETAFQWGLVDTIK